MAEYIEKEAACRVAVAVLGLSKEQRNAVRRYMDGVPAADVRENVKGEWTRNRDYAVCPVCGYQRKLVLSFQRGWIFPKFCEGCGAQMGGAEEWKQRRH